MESELVKSCEPESGYKYAKVIREVIGNRRAWVHECVGARSLAYYEVIHVWRIFGLLDSDGERDHVELNAYESLIFDNNP